MSKSKLISNWMLSISYVILVSCCNIDNTPKSFSEIKISANLPLTGAFSTYGEAVRDGALMAIDDLKDSSDIHIIFDWQDNNSTAKQAVNIYQKQKISGYDIYTSGVKPQTMSIIDQTNLNSSPHIVWIFDAFITESNKNIFRTWVNYKYEPEYYLKYVEKNKPEKIALIYVQLPHTDEEFNKILIPQLNNKGYKDLFVEPYLYDKSDFKDVATKVNSFNPDLIILNGFKGNLIQLIKAFREYNLIYNENTICTYDLLDASEDLSMEMLEGLRLIIPQFETRSTNKLKVWKEKFRLKYNREPRYTDAYAYDMTYSFYHAGKIKALSDTTQMSNALLQVEFEGITGSFKFDDSGDLNLKLDIGYYHNGKLLYEEL